MRMLSLSLLIFSFLQIETSAFALETREFCGQLKHVHWNSYDMTPEGAAAGLFKPQGSPAYVQVRDRAAVKAIAKILLPNLQAGDWVDLDEATLVKVCLNYEALNTEYSGYVLFYYVSRVSRARLWINGRLELDQRFHLAPGPRH